MQTKNNNYDSCSEDTEEMDIEEVNKIEAKTHDQVKKIIVLLELLFGNHSVLIRQENVFSVMINNKYIDFSYHPYLKIIGRLIDPYYLKYNNKLGRFCIYDLNQKGYYKSDVNASLSNYYLNKTHNTINFTSQKQRYFTNDHFSENLIFDFIDNGNLPEEKYKMTSIDKLDEFLVKQCDIMKGHAIKKYSVLMGFCDCYDIRYEIMSFYVLLGYY